MQLLAGTSGFSYKEWVGEFYPDKLAGQSDARALRDALADRRDQQHFLSHAERRRDPGLAFSSA